MAKFNIGDSVHARFNFGIISVKEIAIVCEIDEDNEVLGEQIGIKYDDRDRLLWIPAGWYELA